MSLDQRCLTALAPVIDANRWWVALSGGRDSTALLDLVCLLAQEQRLPPINAIHVNHGMHAHAGDWQQHCELVCEQLAVPLRVARVDVPERSEQGLEAAARAARYAVFRDLLDAGDVLLMAHHADDQIETVLYRLLRGAGPVGLAGMPEHRPLGAGSLRRPLLNTPRSDVEAWLSARELGYINDPSNENTGFDRNYLRHNVLPVIAARWPGYRQSIARVAHLQRRSVSQLSALKVPTVSSRFAEIGIPVPYSDGQIDRAVTGFSDELYWWLHRLGESPPAQSKLDELARQVLTASADRQPELVLPTRVLRAWRGALYCTEKYSAALLPKVIASGQSLSAEWGSVGWQPAAVGVPENAILSWRWPKAGERIALAGRPSRSIGQCFQEHATPPWWRRRLPLLCFADRPIFLAGVGPLAAATQGESVVAGGLLPIWSPPAQSCVSSAELPDDLSHHLD